MAIDSKEKRLAIGAMALSFLVPAGVTPNATPDQEWRQEIGWLYPGIAVATATIGITTGHIVHFATFQPVHEAQHWPEHEATFQEVNE